MPKYKATAYIRLSYTDDHSSESDSVSNQRKLIENFVERNPDIEVVSEKIDDGYSGIIFDRPAFKEMMQDVTDGNINCVIVKDLSRLGREYIETGRYLRRVFPAYGVRFIAITDSIDTAHDSGDDLTVSVKNIMNAVLYSSAYWLDALCMYALNLTYEEYIWNVPLYSAVFLLRPLSFLVVALIIRKYHPPLSVGKQARAWVSLSVVFPLSTLLIIWQIYTFPNEQQIWHFCLLILDVVDVVFLLLLDHLEQSAVNREKLIAAAERAHVQDENIQALSQAYAGQRKMTHDYRTQLSTLSALLEQGNLEEAQSFLSEMKVHQSEHILLVNTHNAAIDAVLNQKGYIAQRQGIDMRFRVNDLSVLKLPRVDVTIVLANLLDNSMEACIQMPESERWVSVQILYTPKRKLLPLSSCRRSTTIRFLLTAF